MKMWLEIVVQYTCGRRDAPAPSSASLPRREYPKNRDEGGKTRKTISVGQRCAASIFGPAPLGGRGQGNKLDIGGLGREGNGGGQIPPEQEK